MDNDQDIHAVLNELHKIYHTTGHVAIHMATTKMSALRYTGGEKLERVYNGRTPEEGRSGEN